MKEMNLFLVGIVLLLGFAGFAYAEVDNASDSFGNGTVIVLNESNVSVVLNETVEINETNETSDENQTEIVVEINESDLVNESELTNETEDEVVVVVEDEEVIEDLIIEVEQVASDKESISDRVFSYVGGVVDRVNEIHKNLFWIIIILLGVLSLFVYSVFFNYSSAKVCFSKASSLHRRGEQAHVNGDYEKAEKLYSKSYLFREKGEGIVSGGADGSAV